MPNETWAQYGAFGLLSCLVIWSLLKGIPSVLETHRKSIETLTLAHQLVINHLVVAFEKAADECRDERLELARGIVVEREKDRSLLTEQGRQLAGVIAVLKELKVGKLDGGGGTH